jgi:hypothetical protein
VPVASPETHLLDGALRPSGTSPAGVRLEAITTGSDAAAGVDFPVDVRFSNQTKFAMREVKLALKAPVGWSVTAQDAATLATLEAGQQASARFLLRPGSNATIGAQARIEAAYAAEWQGRAISGSNPAWIRAVAPVHVAFRPTFDVEGYHAFAKETRTEWVIPSLPTRLPLVLGRAGKIRAMISNRSTEPARTEIALDLPSGIRVLRPVIVTVPAGGSMEAVLDVEVDAAALPEGRHAARLPVTIKATSSGAVSQDTAEIYVLPSLTAPRAASAPKIDGDLSDMRSFTSAKISPADVWWRRAATNDADLSADFFVAYDAKFLYVGAHVRDELVVCNIAPDDVKAQLRSDAIGITVDPSGASRDTSTTLQAAAFPCTTAGFGARGFRDADARQGLMEETAPGMQVASKKTADGYDFEAAIPWSAMPKQPAPGDEIALNVVLYDGDDKDARLGANISETGVAWAAFEWGGKQALPYLWPRVVLAK